MARKGLGWEMGYYRYALLVLILLVMGVQPVQSAAPKGYLIIPDIALYKSITDTPLANRDYDLTGLGYGTTHLEGTTWITDGWGRVVIAGHTPGGFDHLTELRAGDEIVIVSQDVTTTWRIYDTLITRDNVQYLMPTPDFTLTLITCYVPGELWLIINAKLMVQ